MYGKIGIWTFALDHQPAPAFKDAVAEIEELGYGTLWFGEGFGRDTFSQAWMALNASEHLTVASGIANIAYRDPITTAAAERAINEAHPGRYLLGLGGHRVTDQPIPMDGYDIPVVGKAVRSMTAYLDAMDAVPLNAPAAKEPPRRVLAALGPKMLALAAERTLGAHPYFVSVDHTRRSREILGQDAFLAVEQAVVLDHDVDRAREIATQHVKFYVDQAPHQTANVRRLGFDESELAGPSRRLVDAIVAYGDAGAIEKRVLEHFEAGADHVCLQVLTADPTELPMRQWQELAGLTDVTGGR
ncbi:TIGR03620 family F420-dependent LLM class oxidoreductase [Nonomuraea sp. NPDC050556]|uniref:TIGR03620 family F420-dependent LLM class oxidoreductase n=1 Tax=Nonomuraea sp. NPDC050556 TaxID=3364369 RepID=UPI00378A7C34